MSIVTFSFSVGLSLVDLFLEEWDSLLQGVDLELLECIHPLLLIFLVLARDVVVLGDQLLVEHNLDDVLATQLLLFSLGHIDQDEVV